MTYARFPLEQAFEILARELDDLIGRVLRRDANLTLEHENPNWIVVDQANQDVVMMRSPDLMMCVRFMDAFATKHPSATVDRWSFVVAVREMNIAAREHSVKVPPKLEVVQ